VRLFTVDKLYHREQLISMVVAFEVPADQGILRYSSRNYFQAEPKTGAGTAAE
jgi:hypothetical protein